MSRLKSALQREYENDPNANITFYNPRNTHSVELYFKGEKTAKVMGNLAVKKVQNNDKVSGVLVKRDFKYHVLSASDLSSELHLKVFGSTNFNHFLSYLQNTQT